MDLDGAVVTDELVSLCHSYPMKSGGICAWCGLASESRPWRTDPLLNRLEADFCTWTRPSQLATHDLKQTIYHVAVLLHTPPPELTRSEHPGPVHDRYCTTCESTHDGTETPRGLAWTCDGCGERQEYRAC